MGELEWPTARRYLTPDQRLLDIVVRMRDIEWTPEPEQPEEYRQGWQDACERIIDLWTGDPLRARSGEHPSPINGERHGE